MFHWPVAGCLGFLQATRLTFWAAGEFLVWSILLYAFSACATAYAATLPQFLIFRCTTIIGVCVEYVAGVAWE